ncbi:helix-hairpin-helix domain-containing protein [Aquirufa sp. HETE-83D]|uniref:Helix-hairpin-helix domain-containing protein n=1 Tax=Aquirufa esocilacus TaxID=3096513 RepID=A0ABW6DMG3_9BACT
MKNKIHYYLRFVLAYTHEEIKGIVVLFLMMGIYVLYYIGNEYYSKEQERLEFNPVVWEANYKKISPKSGGRESGGFKSGGRGKGWVDYGSYKSSGKESGGFKSGGYRRQQAIDINTADSAAWVALNGIGPGFAKRIITYREKLGGFYQVDQLKEVYGLDSIWVKENKALLKVGAGVYRFLKINQVEWKDFRHPYLPYGQSKVVLAYRKQHGPMKDFETLLQIQLLDQVAWRRLKPYLSFVVLDNK